MADDLFKLAQEIAYPGRPASPETGSQSQSQTDQAASSLFATHRENLWLALEFGFKSAEDGLNWEAAQEEFRRVLDYEK